MMSIQTRREQKLTVWRFSRRITRSNKSEFKKVVFLPQAVTAYVFSIQENLDLKNYGVTWVGREESHKSSKMR